MFVMWLAIAMLMVTLSPAQAAENQEFVEYCFFCLAGALKWFVVLPLASGTVMTVAEALYYSAFRRSFVRTNIIQFLQWNNVFASLSIIGLFTLISLFLGRYVAYEDDAVYILLFCALLAVNTYWSLQYKVEKFRRKDLLQETGAEVENPKTIRAVIQAHIFAYVVVLAILSYFSL